MFKHFTLRLAVLVTAAVSLGVVFTPTASADEWNKKTTLTFSGPVEIPGKVLPAGSYVFKLLDSNSNRNIVQVFNQDETQLIATIMGLPDYRLNPTGHTVINFEETPAGNPEAIRDWFYPGALSGVQFVYPHHEAMEIARRTHQKVLSMSDEMGQNMSAPSTSANDASVKAMENTPVTGVDENGNTINSNQVVNSKPKK